MSSHSPSRNDEADVVSPTHLSDPQIGTEEIPPADSNTSPASPLPQQPNADWKWKLRSLQRFAENLKKSPIEKISISERYLDAAKKLAPLSETPDGEVGWPEQWSNPSSLRGFTGSLKSRVIGEGDAIAWCENPPKKQKKDKAAKGNGRVTDVMDEKDVETLHPISPRNLHPEVRGTPTPPPRVDSPTLPATQAPKPLPSTPPPSQPNFKILGLLGNTQYVQGVEESGSAVWEDSHPSANERPTEEELCDECHQPGHLMLDCPVALCRLCTTGSRHTAAKCPFHSEGLAQEASGQGQVTPKLRDILGGRLLLTGYSSQRDFPGQTRDSPLKRPEAITLSNGGDTPRFNFQRVPRRQRHHSPPINTPLHFYNPRQHNLGAQSANHETCFAIPGAMPPETSPTTEEPVASTPCVTLQNPSMPRRSRLEKSLNLIEEDQRKRNMETRQPLRDTALELAMQRMMSELKVCLGRVDP